MFCTNCGRELSDGLNFCIYCGVRLANGNAGAKATQAAFDGEPAFLDAGWFVQFLHLFGCVFL